MEKVIFDVDPGVDDAMALLLAFNISKLDIKMISVTFGNVSLEQAVKNACYLVQNFARVDYPVYAGASKGFVTEGVNAIDVHGRTGLGTKIVAKNVKKKPSNYAGYGTIEAMRDYILQNPGEISILSVGPVTNTANLIKTYPEVLPKIKRVYMEIGSLDGKGSITPYSSFNAYCDPEAVDMLIRSGVPITLTTKEIGTTAYFEQDQRERFKKTSRTGEFVYDLCEGYKDSILKAGQYAVHDSCVLLSMLHPECFTRQNMDMEINTSFDKKRGQTKFRPNKNSHITVVDSVDKYKVFKVMENIYKKG